MISKLETLPGDVQVKTDDGQARPACCHYWIIEPPNGSSSRGVCKFCKEEREFNNSVERYVIKKTNRARYPAMATASGSMATQS